MKWLIFPVVILIHYNTLICNAVCIIKEDPKNLQLQCKNTTFEEYEYFMLNSVNKTLGSIDIFDSYLDVLDSRFFDFEYARDIRTFEASENYFREIKDFTFSDLKQLVYISFYTNLAPMKFRPYSLFGLESLKQIMADLCNIVHIETGTFMGLPKLEKIRLVFNNITTIQKGAFIGAVNVNHLDLSFSHINHIEADAFIGLDNLDTLLLSINELKTLTPGMFNGLTKLNTLELERNKLESFNFKALNGLNNLESLTISGNKFYKLDVTDNHVYTPKLRTIKYLVSLN